MTGKPLISIITITFNAASVLRPTMESVAVQTFRDFEHIIIDGASTDNTLSLARSLSSGSLRILSEPDNGLYFAMNKGLEMARGEFVVFLNAGDSFHTPDTLSLYASATGERTDIIYADTVIVGPDRRTLRPRHLSTPEVLTTESFANGMLVCHQAFMVRRRLAPRFDTTYRFSADYDWTIKCIARTRPGNCTNLHTIAIDYLEEGVTTSNHRASLAERFRIMCNHYGTTTAIIRHIGFIGRAIRRKVSSV